MISDRTLTGRRAVVNPTIGILPPCRVSCDAGLLFPVLLDFRVVEQPVLKIVRFEFQNVAVDRDCAVRIAAADVGLKPRLEGTRRFDFQGRRRFVSPRRIRGNKLAPPAMTAEAGFL